MTEEEFRRSTFRDTLHAFIISDCGQAFIALLERKPASLPEVNGIHYTDSVMARMYAEVAGANDTVKRIKELSNPWVDNKDMIEASERPQWVDGAPKHIREAYEKFLKNQQQL